MGQDINHVLPTITLHFGASPYCFFDGFLRGILNLQKRLENKGF